MRYTHNWQVLSTTRTVVSDPLTPLRTTPGEPVWRGDSLFLLRQLILKDFRIRYRNMSLGLLWSVLNPLIMVVVYTFVFTQIFKSTIPHFPLFVLSGLIPFNFFAQSWMSATNSIMENSSLVKRTAVRRELFPIAGVLSNVLHLVLQLLMIVAWWFT